MIDKFKLMRGKSRLVTSRTWSSVDRSLVLLLVTSKQCAQQLLRETHLGSIVSRFGSFLLTRRLVIAMLKQRLQT